MPAPVRSSTTPAPRAAPFAVLALGLALAVLTALALLAPRADANTYAGEIAVGPLGAFARMGNVDLASDGSGAVVFTVVDGGAEHVFVSRLDNGAWLRPERLDGAFGAPSDQPVVSAGAGGRVAVAFVNAGNVIAVTKPSSTAGWSGPQAVWGSGGASAPSLDLSVNGKGYLAFAAPGGGGSDVRVAYSKDAGPWALAGAALDANVNANAGAGAGRPKVGAAADGIGIVAWGEDGHVWARRVQGARPSVVAADATAGLAIEGVAPAAADLPAVGAPDDDSFTGIAFRALFPVNGALRSRVVYRRLRGSRFEDGAAADATPFGAGQGSVEPRISNGGVGQGIVLGTNDVSHVSYAMLMRADVLPGPVVQVDSIAASTAPTYAVPVTATPLKMMVAWQYTGADGATDLRGRFYNGREFEAEQVLSKPELGPIRADLGLSAAGDDQGDIVVAYVQLVPGQGPAIAVATVDQPPGRFSPKAPKTAWQRTDRPVLSWTSPREAWGLSFAVTFDGAPAGTTGHLGFRLPSPVAQGEHTWQVTATDRRGQQFAARPYKVRVDSVAPVARVRVGGARRPGATLRLSVQASDDPPPPAAGAQPAKTSGVGELVLDWGDRSRRQRIRAGAQHVYERPGRYTVSVVVLDKAGNRAEVRQVLRIAAPPRPRGARGDAPPSRA
jgi:hypothetical protein